MEEAPEELLERLAQTEKLVVQLKDLIREKDALLQEKETALKVLFFLLGPRVKCCFIFLCEPVSGFF